MDIVDVIIVPIMIIPLLYLTAILTISWFGLKWFLRRTKRKNTIGIFHLYCSSGGGGERVLWHLIKILLDKYPKHTIYIYTHNTIRQDPLQILIKANNLFKIDLISDSRALDRLEFVPLSLAPLVEARKYPFLTLLFQNVMSMFVAMQAAYNIIPEVYIETIGFTFTLPIFKFSSCNVITYVHYPTISSDMVKNVRTSSHASFNNRAIFVKSSIMRQIKLIYYKCLAYLYALGGRCADLVLVNSSWTQGHIKSLWGCEAYVVYPPCDIESFKSLPLGRFKDRTSSNLNIVSIAQFRPEKDHQLQIEAFDLFVNRADNVNESRLTLFGGCRDAGDQKRINYLRDLIHRLDLGTRVDLVVNAPFEQLLEGMRNADVAIHSMANEHFGIVLLEFMASGLITVAHNSGGPRTDIIDNGRNGFLCDNVDEFADVLCSISKMAPDERQRLRASAVKKSDQFSNQVFEQSLLDRLARVCPLE